MQVGFGLLHQHGCSQGELLATRATRSSHFGARDNKSELIIVDLGCLRWRGSQVVWVTVLGFFFFFLRIYSSKLIRESVEREKK